MNLFELFVKIGVDDQASGNLSKITDKLGKGLKTAAKVGVAAVTAAGTAIVGLTKASVDSYAEYEQLVGGVETLFDGSKKSFDEFTKSIGTSWSEIAKYQKEAGLAITGTLDSATIGSLQSKYESMSNAHNVVLENAANAYKTAGMSANEYMETVTSFSASLISCLGGDTASAAEYADIAITDMADNANKMGTSIEMIQNAYQGFAKQNYTMLDNLKLGYGGTKTEMQRLIKDASELSDSVDKNSMSFANIVEAIHVMQTEMGISGITMEEYNELVASGAMTQEEAFELLGTTAKEASFTISGSISSMKAAWSNLITGLADDEADFDSLMNNFVSSVKTAVGNIAPRIGTALNGVAKLIQEIVPVAMQYIPQIITEFLPTIGEAAIGIVTSIGTAIFDNIDQILEWGQNMLDTLLEGINSNTGNIASVVTQIVTTFGTFILENLPEIIMAGFNLLIALVQGIIASIPELATAATQAIIQLASYIISAENLEKLISLGGELINALSEGIENVVAELVSVGEKVVESIKSGISSAWNGLASWFNGLWNSLFGNRTVNVHVNATHSGAGGSFAKGLTYVPYDGFIAELHRGERVLTAKENREYYDTKNENINTSGITIIQNIQSVPQTPVELAAATSAYFEQARWAF